MGTPDWRNQLPSELRQNTINSITEILKDQFPFTGEPIEVVQRSVAQYEAYVFYSSANQEEYIRRTTLRPLPELQNEDASLSSSNIPVPPSDLDNSDLIPMVNIPLDEEPASNEWRVQLRHDLRLQKIETLVENMRMYPDPKTGRRSIDELMTVAINYEQSSFYAAINEEDYYDLITEKIIDYKERHGL